MKASPRQQRLLLDLQHLDNALARLRRARHTLPERAALTALSGEEEEARDRYMQAQRELDTFRGDLARIEDDALLVQQRLDRDEQLLSASTSSKEALALQSELDTLKLRQRALEDRQLEAMESTEKAEVVFTQAQSVLTGAAERRTVIVQHIVEAEHRIDRELSAVSEEREGLCAEVQRDLLEVYEQVRARTGIGAAKLRGNVSEASNMSLAPAEMSDIRAAAPDEVVFCPGTGAILVREQEEEHS